MKKILVITSAIILLAAACNRQAPVPPGNQTATETSFSGKLIAGGVECQLFQSNDNKLYTLSGNLAGFKEGDSVNIKGALQEMSTCQQGEGTIAVSAITRADGTMTPLPSPKPCPKGTVPIGITQSIPGSFICGPAKNVQPAPKPAPAPISKITAPLGQEFQVRVNGTAEIAGEPLTVTFENVVDDSRCPADVTCVWAGDATVRVKLMGTNAEAGSLDLHTLKEDLQAGNFQKYRIQLIRLLPASSVSPEKYIATLKVTK